MLARLIYACGLAAAAYMSYYRASLISTSLFYMLLALAAFDLAIALISYFRLRFKHSFDRSAVNKNETINYVIELANKSPFVVAPMSIDYAGDRLLVDGDTLTRQTLLLLPHKRQTLRQTIACKYRGSYQLGIKSLTVNSLFQLFNLRFRSVHPQTITVYPRIHHFDKTLGNRPVDVRIESLLCVNQRDKSNFSKVRPYEAGDSLKRVHWKLTAKRGDWLSKQFEGSHHQQVSVLINNRLTDYAFDKRIVIEDQLVETVVALVRYYLAASIDCYTTWYDGEIKHFEGANDDHFAPVFNVLTHLSFQDFDSQLLLENLPDSWQQSDSQVVFVTATLEAVIGDQFVQWSQRGRRVFVVLVSFPTHSEYGGEQAYDDQLLLPLLEQRIAVFRARFEGDQCRLEVLT